MTEAEKMVAGLPYDIMAPELKALRRKAHQAIYAYNRSDPLEDAPQSESLAGLLGSLGSDVFVETPFRCAYGVNTHLGDGVYINTGCVILDCARVEIGAKTLPGPAVQRYTTLHPPAHVQAPPFVASAAPRTHVRHLMSRGAAG